LELGTPLQPPKVPAAAFGVMRLLFILYTTVGLVLRPIHRKQRFQCGCQPPAVSAISDERVSWIDGSQDDDNIVMMNASSSSSSSTGQTAAQPPPIDRPTTAILLLLSLQHPERYGRFCPTVANVWKWKDAVLGDGRDFFIPRPKTLAKLQQYLMSQVEMIRSIVVLSNCARLELLVTIRHDNETTRCTSVNRIKTESKQDGDGTSSSSLLLVREAISRALLLQVHHYQSQRFFLLDPPPIDWPSSIAMNPEPRHNTGYPNDDDDEEEEMVQQLVCHWNAFDTLPLILTHWCHVASGLSTRANRPDRTVAFRPFSSRDAHIMLQFKRLVVLMNHNKDKDDSTTTNTTTAMPKWIVDTALAAGKAARSNAIVHAYRPLLLDSTQPMPQPIAQQVQEEVIQPLVQRALTQWNAKSAGRVIQTVRQQALALAETNPERQWIQRTQLHNITMVLRQNDEHDTVDTESFLADLKQRLAAQRSSIG
jgi:hypothetical protein